MCSIIGAEDFDIPQAEFVEGFFRTKTRGPDMYRINKRTSHITVVVAEKE